MPKNTYFADKYTNTAEQNLIEDLIVEAIEIHGDDMLYIPRIQQNYDPIYEADDSSLYRDSYTCVMWPKTRMGFTGDKDIVSVLGGEARDEIVFTVSQREFAAQVTAEDSEITRPRESDIIYFPVNDRIFMVKFVEQRETFYQLGKLYTYEITCELFEYSGERFETGIPSIDNLASRSTNIVDWCLLTEDGERILDEEGDYIVMDGYDLAVINPNAQNAKLQTEFNDFVDWSEIDPFTDGNL